MNDMNDLNHFISAYGASTSSSPYTCTRKLHRHNEFSPPTPPQEPEDHCQSASSALSATETETLSPPSPAFSAEASLPPRSSSILSNGLHVFQTASAALANLSDFYWSSSTAQAAFTRAVSTIVEGEERGGKLVICGMGKSGRIGEKLVATFNSLGFTSVFLHPAEAVHGDLGVVKEVR